MTGSSVFAGSPEFAASILDALIAAGRAPVAVLTQPDRPAGRGRKLTPSAVKRRALDAGIEVLDPARLKSQTTTAGMAPQAALQRLSELQPEVMIVAAYGLILPPAVLDMPLRGCLNVHASLLPRWRGAAPVERAIMAGDADTGVCIMQMEAGLDTGPVWLQRPTAIGALETGGELEQRLAGLGAEALLDVLRDWPGPPQPQPEAGVTYAQKLQRDDARADFELPAMQLARRIRALNPRLPVAAMIDDTRLRLLRADHLDQNADAAPGTIVAAAADGIMIACATGTLRLLEAQVLKGKARILDAAALRNGFADLLAPGRRLHAV